MIYVVDPKTGEVVAELLGDAEIVAQKLLNERRLQGLDVSMAKKSFGYVISQRDSRGHWEPVLAVRGNAPVSLSSVVFKYSIMGGLIAVSVVLTVICRILDAGLDLPPTEPIDLTETRFFKKLLNTL